MPAATPGATTTLEHVGECKVKFDAESIEELFAEVARFIASSNGRAGKDNSSWEHVRIVARDGPTLLADWANELLGRSEASNRAYHLARSIIIERHPHEATLTAEVSGPSVDVWHSPLKAATYHSLELEQRDHGWHAVILFDV